MNATYFCNGIEYPATVRLDKKGLLISVVRNSEHSEVLWQYDEIILKEAIRSFGYNGYPPQTLEVLEPALAADLQALIHQSKKTVRRRKLAPFAQLLIAAIAVFAILYIALVPWLAGALASRFPVRYERQLGDRIYQAMKQDFDIDEGATVAINRFFTAIKFPVAYPINITVVKGDVVNAFALPGGHIIVYDKLLHGLNSYEELAALLAHEAVHIQERHTVRTLFRQAGSAILLSLLIGDASAVSTVILGNANELKNLSYSRSLETEADEAGARFLSQRGINCVGFVRLFQFLKKQEDAAQPTEWLSSHPNLQKRIAAIQKNGDCSSASSPKNDTLQGLFLRLKTAE